MLNKYIKNLKLTFNFKKPISTKPLISLGNDLIKYNREKGYKDLMKNKIFIKKVL